MIQRKIRELVYGAIEKRKLASVLAGLCVAGFVSLYQHYSQTADFKFRNKTLIYSKHALCRMSCRDITSEELRYIIETGRVNQLKSNKNSKPCPSVSIEHTTKDGQSARVVLGDCPENYTVITVIDLGIKHECNCS